MKPIAGILFDMDGVLCFSEPFITEASMRMLKERYDLDVQPKEFLPFVGAGEARYAGGVAEKYGVSLDLPGDKDRIYEIYFELIPNRLQALPGVHQFVEACRDRGLRLAVASSADRIKVNVNLQEIGLDPSWFDAIMSGSDITHKKPDPEIFLKAADAIGLPPDQCLVVEDAQNGITAGLRAGCRCLGITSCFDEAALRESGAAWVAADLTQVPDTIPFAAPLAADPL